MGKARFIDAGHIVNTHGVKGEVKIEVWLDSPEFLKRFPTVYVDGKAIRMRSPRIQKRFLLAALEGIEDVNAAMTLKGKTIQIAREDAGLAPGEYFLQDILGASVCLEDGSPIGTLTDILERPASDIYVVTDTAGRERLIPAADEFIRRVDAEAGVVAAMRCATAMRRAARSCASNFREGFSTREALRIFWSPSPMRTPSL